MTQDRAVDATRAKRPDGFRPPDPAAPALGDQAAIPGRQRWRTGVFGPQAGTHRVYRSAR